MRKGKERTPIEELDTERNLNRIHLHALPDSWEWRTVEDAGINQKNAIVDGPFGSNLKVSDYVEGGPVPVLTTKNLEGNYDDVRYISNDKFEELKRSAVHSGDILMAKIGSCGKTGIYPPEKPPAIIPANLLKITLNERYERKYVFYYLNSEFFQRALRTIIKATAQPAFSVTNFRTLPLPYTEVRMQKRIIAEIEKQFSRLDEAVTNLKRVKANLKRYRASVLKAAVEGRLVETEAEIARREGREYETGKQLLERILETRRREWKGKGQYKEPAAPDVSELPEMPEGWAWGSLNGIASLKGGITVDSKRNKINARLVPYLRVANVQRGYLDLSEIKHIPVKESDIADLRLEYGDILFNEGGDRDKLGRGWIWESQLVDCIHQNHVFRARLYSSDMPPSFVSWWGNTFGKEYFSREGKQSTNLASINLTKLSALPVPIPPLAEQRRIVAEVDRRLSLVRETEAQVEANLKRAEQLRQAVLQKAFSGELVRDEAG
ncbi:restriction endonuclease subunit S [Leptonema illini]|uniref:Restriction modification system DNA specificity domain-containing protein n=1 Tax=Leptonema illini DSM 21528 TaxID=929563 RepID=H2CID3_9LEPT|nr:restriction endonuclease subunit S [Leptonema illini]EHQ04906.1 restriction modification system DNA specificity domain-containing protein [Leptonema illini DSM 21528]